MERFAFFCTDNKGWEGDDYRLFATTLLVLASTALVYWFLLRRISNKVLRTLLYIVAAVAALIAIGAGAVIIWLAPC